MRTHIKVRRAGSVPHQCQLEGRALKYFIFLGREGDVLRLPRGDDGEYIYLFTVSRPKSKERPSYRAL